MKLRRKWKRDARLELVEGVRFNQGPTPKSGRRFKRTVEETIAGIEAAPDRGALVLLGSDVHREAAPDRSRCDGLPSTSDAPDPPRAADADFRLRRPELQASGLHWPVALAAPAVLALRSS